MVSVAGFARITTEPRICSEESNRRENARGAQRVDQPGDRRARFGIDGRAAARFGGRFGDLPAAEVDDPLAGRFVEHLKPVARGDEQPVAELAAGKLAFLAVPCAGRAGADEPAIAVLGIGRRVARFALDAWLCWGPRNASGSFAP